VLVFRRPQQQWQEQQGGPPLRSSEDRQYGEDIDVGKRADSSGWGSNVGMLSPLPSQSLGPSQSQLGGVGGRGDRRGVGPMGLGPGRGGPGRGAAPTSLQVKRSGGGIQVGEHTGFLRMRGLPFAAAREDIYSFFQVYNPILETIVLTYRSDGRATGEAYIGFETPEDSKRAMELHRKSMGNRYIELFLSNKEEHGRALTRFGDR
jgi:heterogeneous nuclear ribonucleoprotein F/H